MSQPSYSSLNVLSQDSSEKGCFSLIFEDVLNPEVLTRLTPDALKLFACRAIRLFTFGFLAVILGQMNHFFFFCLYILSFHLLVFTLYIYYFSGLFDFDWIYDR